MPIAVAFAILLIGPWLFGRATAAVRLPSILGMLLFGILYGALSGGIASIVPALPSEISNLSAFLKRAALIVILLRAGLGIQRATLARVGASAVRMAIVPCLIETAIATAAFVRLFEFDLLTALLGGSILAAVSPAVVVPSMLELKERGYGALPTLILAGASVDDAVAITIFTAALGIATGGSVSVTSVVISFPIAIAAGLALGAALGFLGAWFFTRTFEQIRATEKALLLVVVSLLIVELGDVLPVAALLAVMTVGFVLLERAEQVAHELADKLAKVWVPAELLLFVLIGLAVDLPTAAGAGLRGLAVIGLGLLGRSIGVLISVVPDRGLNRNERLFALIAYIPKATVQAALGAIPLSLGIPGGQEILAVAVLAIAVTAPLGLFLIRWLGPRLLAKPAATQSHSVA
ncbi:MAG: cation:proton antiporter [Spirochaetales bacterium]